MVPPERVTVIGRSSNTAPVHRARCSLSQQLSGPLTDTKRCRTTHSVLTAAAGGVGDDGLGEEEPQPQAVRLSAMASVEIRLFITTRSATAAAFTDRPTLTQAAAGNTTVGGVEMRRDTGAHALCCDPGRPSAPGRCQGFTGQ